MNILFDSQSVEYKSPYGAVPCGEEIKFRIKVDKELDLAGVTLVILEDNKKDPSKPTPFNHPMKRVELGYEVSVKAPSAPILLFYYFELKFRDGSIKYYGNNLKEFGGVGHIYDSFPKNYQITTYEKYNKTPDWFKKSIIYQIFPDRFFNGNPDGKINNPKKNSFIYGNWEDTPMYIKDENGDILRWDFYGGNLLGVIKKLDYLESLGVNLIYLNPIFKSRSNHRYDTGDYSKIDSMLGTEEDFKKLIEEGKKRGINIILDGVFNHTGMDSMYFNALNTYDSIGAYNSKESPYYDWFDFKEYPDEYESWWGIKDLPCIKGGSKSFEDYIISSKNSIVSKWLKMGIKGWRLDVADELSEKFLKALKRRCEGIDEESILLGEVWEDATNKISYGERREYMCGDELTSVTNYSFRNYFVDFLSGKIEAQDLSGLFERMRENYPKENLYALTNLIGTHDVSRILTEVGSIKQLKLMVAMQMLFFGVPLIYYGDEAGVTGGTDPENRKTYPWGNENVEILEWYKKFTKLRSENEFLSTGYFEQIVINEDVYGIRRYTIDKKDAFGNRLDIKKDKELFAFINRNSEKTYKFTYGGKKISLKPLGVEIFV